MLLRFSQTRVSILLSLDTGWKSVMATDGSSGASFNPLKSGYGLEEHKSSQSPGIQSVKMKNLPRHSKIFKDKLPFFFQVQASF